MYTDHPQQSTLSAATILSPLEERLTKTKQPMDSRFSALRIYD